MPRVLKKQRIAKEASENAAAFETTKCHITRLPFELIAEILLLTRSSRDVLALARCNKFFCATLLTPSSEYIWRKARQNCIPAPLPDKPKYLTEPSYAALVFGGGLCEVCHNFTDKMYLSFALKLRVCKEPMCQKGYRDILKIVSVNSIATGGTPPEWHGVVINSSLVAENNAILSPSNIITVGHGTWPRSSRVIRRSDWDQAVEAYVEATSRPDTMEAELQWRARMARKVAELMPFFVKLYDWRLMYDAHCSKNKMENELFAKTYASTHGYAFWDLLNTKTYGAIHRSRNKTLERVEDQVTQIHRDTIDSEILRLTEHRARRKAEMDYANSRTIVASHYNRLRCNKEELPLPPLATFRKLKIINTVQKTPPGPDFNPEKELKTGLAKMLLKAELESWRERARNALAEALGYPNWKSASKARLHPVDRVDARFLCENCTHIETKYRDDGCFDFVGACSHQCPEKKKGDLPEWTASRFVKDVKASTAISNILTLLGLRAEDPSSSAIFNSLLSRIVCNSCKPALVLDPTHVAGHSHRHKDMDISLLPENLVLPRPLTSGQAVRLLGQESRAKVLRELKVFGCRHCAQVADVDDDAHPATPATPAEIKTWSFNGLRSHLKAKHSIDDVRDEDFFTEKGLEWKVPKAASKDTQLLASWMV